MSIDRDTLDRTVLEVMANMPPDEGYCSTDFVHSMTRTKLGYGPFDQDAPSITKVAHALKRQAERGCLRRSTRDGSWVYKFVTFLCRICGLPEERHGLCPGHREEWIQWASHRPDKQNDEGFDEWIASRRREMDGDDSEIETLRREKEGLTRVAAAARAYFREFDHLIGGDYPERSDLREALYPGRAPGAVPGPKRRSK